MGLRERLTALSLDELRDIVAEYRIEALRTGDEVEDAFTFSGADRYSHPATLTKRGGVPVVGSTGGRLPINGCALVILDATRRERGAHALH